MGILRCFASCTILILFILSFGSILILASTIKSATIDSPIIAENFCKKYSQCRKKAFTKFEQCAGDFMPLILAKQRIIERNLKNTVESESRLSNVNNTILVNKNKSWLKEIGNELHNNQCLKELSKHQGKYLHKLYQVVERRTFDCVDEIALLSEDQLDKSQVFMCRAIDSEITSQNANDDLKFEKAKNLADFLNSEADCFHIYESELWRCNLAASCCPEAQQCQSKVEIYRNLYNQESNLAKLFDRCVQNTILQSNIKTSNLTTESRIPALKLISLKNSAHLSLNKNLVHELSGIESAETEKRLMKKSPKKEKADIRFHPKEKLVAPKNRTTSATTTDVTTTTTTIFPTFPTFPPYDKTIRDLVDLIFPGLKITTVSIQTPTTTTKIANKITEKTIKINKQKNETNINIQVKNAKNSKEGDQKKTKPEENNKQEDDRRKQVELNGQLNKKKLKAPKAANIKSENLTKTNATSLKNMDSTPKAHLDHYGDYEEYDSYEIDSYEYPYAKNPTSAIASNDDQVSADSDLTQNVTKTYKQKDRKRKHKKLIRKNLKKTRNNENLTLPHSVDFFCAQYLECKEVVEEQYDNCESMHLSDNEKHGIEDRRLRAIFIENFNKAYNNNTESLTKIKLNCLKALDPKTQSQLIALRTKITYQIKNCTEKQNDNDFINDIITIKKDPQQCQSIKLLSALSATMMYEETPTLSKKEKLGKCFSRFSQVAQKCNQLRNCCMANSQCKETASEESQQFDKIVTEVKAEQSLCEIRHSRIMSEAK